MSITMHCQNVIQTQNAKRYQHRSIHKRDTGKQHEPTSELLFRNPDIEDERPPESYQIYKQRNEVKCSRLMAN